MSNKEDFLLKAKKYCFCLLKFRARTQAELIQRLKQKGFSEEIIKQTISYLKEKKLINDEEFCRDWIASRIKKKISLTRIKQELKQKGIDQQLIDKEIEKIKNQYSEEEIIFQIIKEKQVKLKDLSPQKLKAKLFAFLLRRGFKPEIVEDSLNQYIKDE